MALTPEQVRLIQNRSPGWEGAWAELARELLGNDGRSGRLCSTVRSLHIRWPDEPTRDDFVAERMQKYQQRAGKGTLLAGFDATKGTPEDYLTSRRTLHFKALDFLAHLKVQQAASVSLGEGTLEQSADLDRDGRDDPERIALLANIQRELERPALRAEGKITRVFEQAGLQLHPRLNWEQQSLARLRDHLVSAIQKPPDESDPFAVLDRVHDAERQHWQAEADQLARELYDQGKFVKVSEQRHLENRWIEVLFQQMFMPLRAEALAKLLGVMKTTADMARFHYRRKLPDLLPSLAKYYELCRRWEQDAR